MGTMSRRIVCRWASNHVLKPRTSDPRTVTDCFDSMSRILYACIGGRNGVSTYGFQSRNEGHIASKSSGRPS